MKKGIITVLLAICILISALPFAQVDAASAAENARLQSYEQFLAYYYQTYSLLDYLMENSDSPCRTIVNNADEDLEGALEIWRKATMDVGDLAKYSEKEIEFYEFLIFDILYQKNALDLGLKNAETAVNVLQSEILNEYAELGLDMTLLTKVTEENVDELLNKLIHFDNLKFLSGNFEALRKAMGYVADVGELSEKLYILLEMNNCSEVVHDILNQLYQKSTDSAMKEACRRVSLISTGLITEAEIIAVFSGRVVLQEAASHVMDKIWGGIVSSTSLGRALSIGKKVGKLTSNIMFGTDAVVENWYSMKQLNTFETVMKSVLKSYQSSYNSSPTYQNALLFNKAADMYMRTHSVGSEYALKYAEVAMGGGFFGWIYKNFTHKDDYEHLIGTLNSIKTNVDCAIDFVNNNTYNFYLDELEACDSAVPAWKPTPTVVTREEVDQKTEEMPELFFRTTNQTTSTSVTYADDKLTYADYTHTDGTLKLNGNTLTIYGDLYLTGGTIDLWTGTLIVRGNVYQSGGSMLINKGRLEIGGDYRIQKRNVDEWGVVSYGGSYGVMRMQYPEDFVAVGRSFVTQSNSGNGSSGNLYSAGTMEIGGDFIQLKHSSSTVSEQNFAASGTHKVILNGAGAQTVSFQSNSSGFNYLEMDQASDVTFKDYLRVNAMHSNGTAKSVGLDLWDFGINGKSMTIVGDMSISGNVDLKLGNLNIDGNVAQTNGIVVLNKGRLTTTGDYRIQKRNVDEWGTVSYSGSSGVMRMQYPEDFVAVGGSFVTQSISGNGNSSNLYSAGTMEIGGDFIQKEHSTAASDQNFAASGTHKVILNGTEAQTVSFQSNSSGFNYLEMDHASDVTFKNYLRVNAMHSNGTAKSVGLNLWNFGINGKSMTIVGDMSISGNVDLKLGNLNIDGDVTQTNGIVVLNKGRLATTGDYRIQKRNVDEWGTVSYSGSSGVMRMQYAEDFVAVGGSFVTQSISGNGSSSNLFSAGTMEIGGDFIQKEHSTVASDQNFAASGTHEVILNGTGAQTVSFQSNLSGFNYLEMDQAEDVTFKNYLRVNAMHSDGYAKSVGLELLNFSINGKSLTIVGDMSISGNVDLKLGNLTVDGDVTHTDGAVVLNKGSLTTTGDYRIQSSSTDEWGVVTYSQSSGTLKMQYEEDTVTVGGSFVTQSRSSYNVYKAGTMKVGGDFVQLRHNAVGDHTSFSPSGTHKVILNGTGLQKVTFQSTSSGFNILDLHRTPTNEYRFSRVPCWKTLLDYGKAHEHDLVSDVTVPTCTKGGFTTYSCYCGHSVVSDYTDALGHNETVDAPVAPGCERTGLTEGAHCDRCGLVLTAQEEIPALGHDHQRGICIRCGDSIVTASGWSGATQWVLTQEGELIVYGQGNMKNYGWTGGQPWAAYAGQVRSVVIEQGVKQVGSGAFKDMTSLESVLLPTSLKTIGIAAFYGCTALEEIVIPEGIYTVWEYTFKNCTSLETVSLPNTLIKIDQGAFEACTALGELYLPANVNIIGGWSFKGCTALTAVDMHDAVATEIRAGAFKNCTSLTNVILPGNIRTLGDSCFYGIGAEEFVLPTTVDNIGPWCFARSQLRQVTFEGDAPAIGEGAFNKITLTAYYPAGNATWNSMNMLNYGGTITWTAK